MAISQKIERMVEIGEVWQVEKSEGGTFRAWWDSVNGFQLLDLDSKGLPIGKETTPDGDGAAEKFAASMRNIAPLNEWSLFPHEPGYIEGGIPFAEPDGLEDEPGGYSDNDYTDFDSDEDDPDEDCYDEDGDSAPCD